MRCCRGHSSPSAHPPSGSKAAHADVTGFVVQATRNFQSLGETRIQGKHAHPGLQEAAGSPPSRDRGSGGPATAAGPSRDAEPAQAEPWAARGEHPGTSLTASPLLRSRPRAPAPRPTPQAPLQPAVTAKPAHPPRPPPPSPAPGRRTASYTAAGGLRLPTRPRAPLERAQKVRLPRPAALALLAAYVD